MIEMGGVKSVKAVLESEGLGSETASVIHKIVEYRNILQEILNKYNVENIEEIEKKIEKHQISEHPSYEDYLEGLSYRLEIESLLEELEAKTKTVRELVK